MSMTPDNPWSPYSGYHEALFAEIKAGNRIDPRLWVNPATGEVEVRPVRLTKQELEEARADLARRRGDPVTLPPFPVDDATLDMLMAAIDPRSHGDTAAQTSSVGRFLEVMSQLGGSDLHKVEEVVDDGADGGPQIVVMRDPVYHEHSVMAALVEEIRRLRSLVPREMANG